MTDQAQQPVTFLGNLARIEAKPGDRFVLMTDGDVSHDMAVRITDEWKRFMGPDAPRLMILSDGIKLGVVGFDQGLYIDASKAGPSRLVIDPDAPIGDVLRDVDGFEEWFNRIIAEGDYLPECDVVKHQS